jgi:hypothetical protein
MQAPIDGLESTRERIASLTRHNGRNSRPYSADAMRRTSTMGAPAQARTRPHSAVCVHHSNAVGAPTRVLQRPRSAAPVLQLLPHAALPRSPSKSRFYRCGLPRPGSAHAALCTMQGPANRPHSHNGGSVVHLSALNAPLGPERSCPAVMQSHGVPPLSCSRPLSSATDAAFHRAEKAIRKQEATELASFRMLSSRLNLRHGMRVRSAQTPGALAYESSCPNLTALHRFSVPTAHWQRPSTAHAAFHCMAGMPTKRNARFPHNCAPSSEIRQALGLHRPAGVLTTTQRGRGTLQQPLNSEHKAFKHGCDSGTAAPVDCGGNSISATLNAASLPLPCEMSCPSLSTGVPSKDFLHLRQRPSTAHARLHPSALAAASTHAGRTVPAQSLWHTRANPAIAQRLLGEAHFFAAAETCHSSLVENWPLRQPPSAALSARGSSSCSQKRAFAARPVSAPSIVQSSRLFQRGSSCLRGKGPLDTSHVQRLGRCSQSGSFKEGTAASHARRGLSSKPAEQLAAACVDAQMSPQKQDTGLGPLDNLGRCPLIGNPMSRLGTKSTSSQVRARPLHR